jgi:hypothetical protein
MRLLPRRNAFLAALLPALLMLAMSLPAHAQEVAPQDSTPLKGGEIAALLAGNAIEGTWGPSHFRNYFATDGTTLYQAQGQPPEQGHWKIVDDQYCSVADEGDACFNLYRSGGDLIWEEPRTHQRFSSKVIPGKAVPW